MFIRRKCKASHVKSKTVIHNSWQWLIRTVFSTHILFVHKGTYMWLEHVIEPLHSGRMVFSHRLSQTLVNGTIYFETNTLAHLWVKNTWKSNMGSSHSGHHISQINGGTSWSLQKNEEHTFEFATIVNRGPCNWSQMHVTSIVHICVKVCEVRVTTGCK